MPCFSICLFALTLLCTHTHTYIHARAHTHTHTHIHTYIHTYTLTRSLTHLFFHSCQSDINGNLKKLTAHQEKTGTTTLQAMVRTEMEKKTTKKSGSATDALLWLKRALSFIRIFLAQYVEGAQLKDCAGTAYTESLRKYHNFLVRGVFSMAMKAVPSREGFSKALGGEGATEEDVVAEVKVYAEAMAAVLEDIDAFYSAESLE